MTSRLDTDPATRTQRSAIVAEFHRLGVTDRAERLSVCAALLGLDELDSTADLVLGEAGRLVNLLRQRADHADLMAVALAATTDDDGQDDEAPAVSVVAVIADVLRRIAAAMYGAESALGDAISGTGKQ